MSDPDEPTLLRPAGPTDGTGIGAYRDYLSSTRGLVFDDYRDLWRWSVAEPEEFWISIWEHYQLVPRQKPVAPLTWLLATWPGQA